MYDLKKNFINQILMYFYDFLYIYISSSGTKIKPPQFENNLEYLLNNCIELSVRSQVRKAKTE
jgi:hypothetical protein